MYRNYLTVGYRSIARQKLHTAINVVGLSVAVACLLLISLFIRDERSFDSFHANADSIYKVIDCTRTADGSIRGGTVVCLPVGPALAENFPQVEKFVRILWAPPAVVKYGDRVYGESVRCVDEEFFQLFSFKLVAGDSISALKEPYSVVIDQEAAVRYFGDDDPIGRTLTISLGAESSDYTVTAVSSSVPSNSSIRFSFLMPIQRHPDYQRLSTKWNSSSSETWVQLSTTKEMEELEAATSGLLARMRGHNVPPSQIDSTVAYPHFLGFQSLRDIHLNPHGKYGLSGRSTREKSYILTGIALLILLMACINFTTLAIGRLTSRIPEVGARKALGASRVQLVGQFLAETLLLSAVAMVAGIALAEIFLPVFNSLSGKELTIRLWSELETPGILIAMTLMIGLIAGAYPATVMSRVAAVDALRGSGIGIRNGLLTRGLVLLQFALSIFLVASATVMSNQLQFIDDKDLGYNSDQLITISTYTGRGEEGDRLLQRYKHRLAAVPEVLGVTGMDYSFSMGYDQEGWMVDGESRTAYAYRVDPDFIPTVEAKLIEGRDFTGYTSGTSPREVIVNETLVEEFGLQQPIGETLRGWGTSVMGDSGDPTIIGVISDIHFGSLQRRIKPVVVHLNPRMSIYSILVRISPENIPATLDKIENEFRLVAPEKPFDYAFVDDHVAKQYEGVRKWEKIVGYSAAFAILIACLGLFGLTTLSVARRTREIGIRKVLGASISRILYLIGWEFLVLVVIANVVAWPIAYIVMREWLSTFIYRTELEPAALVIAGTVALMVALVAVSYQAIRAALANPVDALRHE